MMAHNFKAMIKIYILKERERKLQKKVTKQELIDMRYKLVNF